RPVGSPPQALHFAAQAIMSGTQDIVIAAGVESMTRVPMGTPVILPAQNGLGTPMSPGRKERYPHPHPSHQKGVGAPQGGAFKDEIVAIEIPDADGVTSLHTVDEGIRFDASLEG